MQSIGDTLIAEVGHPNRHVGVAPSRLIAVASKQPIPPGEIEAEIAVGLAGVYRMMNAVHIGRNDKPPHHAIHGDRHTDVAVVEHARRVEQYFEDQDRHRRWAEQQDHRRLESH